MARRGKAGHGLLTQRGARRQRWALRCESAGSGTARHGRARLGPAWLGEVWLGLVRAAHAAGCRFVRGGTPVRKHHEAWPGCTRPGTEGHGKLWRGVDRLGKAWAAHAAGCHFARGGTPVRSVMRQWSLSSYAAIDLGGRRAIRPNGSQRRRAKRHSKVALVDPGSSAMKARGLEKRFWRREGDSNPRWAINPYTLSRRAP